MTTRNNIRKWDLAAKAGPRQANLYQAFRDAWTRLAVEWMREISRAAPRTLHATCESVNVAPFGYWSEQLGGPRGVAVVRSQALRAPGLVVFSRRAADIFTNALHGGPVTAARRYGEASLDGFGAAVLRRIAAQGLQHFDDGLFAPHQLHFKLTRQETSIGAAAIVRDDEPMLRIQFRIEDLMPGAEVGSAGVSGTIDLLLPEAAVRKVAQRAAPERTSSATVSAEALSFALVTLSAELAATELELRELLRLAVGDEILFNAEASETVPVTVLVEGKEHPQIQAQVAIVGGRRVLKIA